jgi:hypothetical protein
MEPYGVDEVGLDDAWRPGRVIAGRYELAAVVGVGAMGAVWRAFDRRLDRLVAVKQLRVPLSSTSRETDRARQRVLREARAAARLQHPHAVTVYDVTSDDEGQPVLVMEYIPSQTLADVLTRHGALPPARAARIGAQTAAALAAAHAAGIVHRDVKPGNILLSTDGTGTAGGPGTAKITDFGLARTSGDVTVTGTGLLAGTPAFLAPEAARGERPGPASDVFSLGATLYAAVEGTPPFGMSGNPAAQLHRVATGHVAPPRQAGPLTRPLMAMLHDDPALRPTMSQVADTLAVIAEDPGGTEVLAAGPAPTRLDLHPLIPPRTTPPATPPAPPTPAAPAGRRGPVVAGVLAAALLILLAAILLPGDDPGTSARPDPRPTSPATARPATPAPPDPALLRRTVTEYYTLLADHPRKAWRLLGPRMRDQDRERYEKHWDEAKDLRLRSTPTVTGTTVVAEVEYTLESRGQVRETHRHAVVVQNGTALIDSDELLSSDVVTGGDRDKEDDDEQDRDDRDKDGDKKGKKDKEEDDGGN